MDSVPWELARRVEIPYLVPSHNTTNKMHWTKRNEERQRAAMMLRARVGFLGAAEQVKRAVRITAYRPRLIRDRVNLAAGCKMLIDALVEVGLLYDDSMEWMDDHYRQIRESGPGRVVVEVY